MGLKSPGTILKLWTKTVKKLEEGKKATELPKKGNEQKLKIKNGLTALKLEAANAKNNPEAFVKKRDRSALLLRKFCRYLKSSKDEDKKLTQKHMKALMALAVVVQKLDPGNIDLNEDEGKLEELEQQDTTALAESLEKPDSEPEDGAAPLPGDMTATPAADRQQPSPKPTQRTTQPDDKAVKWKERDAKFVPHFKVFLQAGSGDIAGVKKLYIDATTAASKGNYEAAIGILDKLEPILVKGAVTGMVGWQKAKIDTIHQIRQLQTALVKTKRPEALEIAKILESVPAGLEIHPDSEDNRQALEKFITTDDIISKVEMSNPWGIRIIIREPLLKALAGLKK
jgi:hypothetical protein